MHAYVCFKISKSYHFTLFFFLKHLNLCISFKKIFTVGPLAHCQSRKSIGRDNIGRKLWPRVNIRYDLRVRFLKTPSLIKGASHTALILSRFNETHHKIHKSRFNGRVCINRLTYPAPTDQQLYLKLILSNQYNSTYFQIPCNKILNLHERRAMHMPFYNI